MAIDWQHFSPLNWWWLLLCPLLLNMITDFVLLRFWARAPEDLSAIEVISLYTCCGYEMTLFSIGTLVRRKLIFCVVILYPKSDSVKWTFPIYAVCNWMSTHAMQSGCNRRPTVHELFKFKYPNYRCRAYSNGFLCRGSISVCWMLYFFYQMSTMMISMTPMTLITITIIAINVIIVIVVVIVINIILYWLYSK